MQVLGGKIEAVGKALAPLSAFATGTLVGIAKTSIDFDDAWTGVTKTVEGSDEELRRVRQDIIDLSKSTGISKNEIARCNTNGTDNWVSKPKSYLNLLE